MNISSYIETSKIDRENQIAQTFKILSSPARFKIIKLLSCDRQKEICVREISQAIKLSQSATSHQLALLEARGIVKGERMGKTVCYYLTNSAITQAIKKIVRVIC